MEQVWKDLSGFPGGPVSRTAMLTLVPLHRKENVLKVLLIVYLFWY